MKKPNNYCCEEIIKRALDDETAININKKFREFGISVLDGGSSHIVIKFCPWCGAKLPSLLRDKWFQILEELGFDEPSEQNIPDEFKSEEWWQKRNL